MPENAIKRREERRGSVLEKNGVSHSVHRPINPQKILDTTARLACEMLKGDLACVCLVDDEGYLTISSQVGLPERGAARWRVHSSIGPMGTAFQTRRLIVSMEGTYPEELAPGLSLYGALLAPLCIGKSVIGVLGVGYKQKHELSPEDLELANLFASFAAMAIEAAALYETESDERRRSDALLKIVRTSHSDRGLKELLTKLSRLVLKLSVAERCAIFVLSEDERSVEAVLSLGGKFPLRWENQVSPEVGQAITPDLLVALADGNTKPIVEERAAGRLVPKHG